MSREYDATVAEAPDIIKKLAEEKLMMSINAKREFDKIAKVKEEMDLEITNAKITVNNLNAHVKLLQLDALEKSNKADSFKVKTPEEMKNKRSLIAEAVEAKNKAKKASDTYIDENAKLSTLLFKGEIINKNYIRLSKKIH
jgi:hypothetical protein